MSRWPQLIGIVFGAALVLLGLFILFSGGIALPTRQPSAQLHFRGVALMCLGLSPLVAGGTVIAIARERLDRESRTVHLAIVVSTGALGLALLLANAM